MEITLSPKNESLLTAKEGKFLLEQAEKTLKDTTEQSQLIVARTTTLITLTSGVLIALLSFSINRWETKGVFDTLLLTSTCCIIYVAWVCFCLARNIQPEDYAVLGSAPAVLMKDEFFAAEGDTREMWFYIAETKRCQQKIEHNTSVNTRRWGKFSKHLYMVLATPLVFALLYFIIHRLY